MRSSVSRWVVIIVDWKETIVRRPSKVSYMYFILSIFEGNAEVKLVTSIHQFMTKNVEENPENV